MASIEYAVPIPEKPHVLHVGLRVTTPTGVVIQEVPLRAAIYNGLTTAKRVVYAQQAAEYHHPTGPDGKAKRDARRAAWDADDLAAVQAKWLARPVGHAEAGLVVVDVTHGGLNVQVRVPADAPDPQGAVREAWQAEDDRRQAEAAALRAFAIS